MTFLRIKISAAIAGEYVSRNMRMMGFPQSDGVHSIQEGIARLMLADANLYCLPDGPCRHGQTRLAYRKLRDKLITMLQPMEGNA